MQISSCKVFLKTCILLLTLFSTSVSNSLGNEKTTLVSPPSYFASNYCSPLERTEYPFQPNYFDFGRAPRISKNDPFPTFKRKYRDRFALYFAYTPFCFKGIGFSIGVSKFYQGWFATFRLYNPRIATSEEYKEQLGSFTRKNRYQWDEGFVYDGIIIPPDDSYKYELTGGKDNIWRSVTINHMIRLHYFCILYAGAGIGWRNTLYEFETFHNTAEDPEILWEKNEELDWLEDWNKRAFGVETEVGVILDFRKFIIQGGVSLVNFNNETMQTTVGVGVHL